MNVFIQTIPHRTQRYATSGDWFWRGQTLHIRVSSTGHWRYDMAVAFHEMMEALLCKDHGVSQREADRFDMGKLGSSLEEPGDDRRAPYYREHTAAYVAEYAFLSGCEIAAGDYHRAVNRLYEAEE